MHNLRGETMESNNLNAIASGPFKKVETTDDKKTTTDYEKKVIQHVLERAGVDIPFIIQESFLGYKYRKMKKKLSVEDASLPTKLIKMYYSLNPGEVEFNNLKKSFISKYAKNESELEGVNDETIHGKEEILGLGDMYEYIHSDEIEEDFNIYSLKELHRKLYSHTPYPECAGHFRNFDAYLPGTGIGLYEWSRIHEEIYRVSPIVDALRDYAKAIKDDDNVDELLEYLDKCVELKVELIRIHPFGDGNGRTVRGFINKMLEDVKLPPIYIKSNERTEYHTAMNKALLEGDYSLIKSFYRYKICDSIIELDINKRVKTEMKEQGKQKEKIDDLK